MNLPKEHVTAQLAERTATVLQIAPLSSQAYSLTFTREDLQFRAGECITLFGANRWEARDYTLCCGESDDALTVLFRLMPGGALTPLLASLRPGDPLRVAGPYGTFTLREPSHPTVFIGTGTGIAPCRAYVRSHPEINIHVLHGVARSEDLFYSSEFSRYRYIPCVSREPGGLADRVTTWLRNNPPNPTSHFYLCGANEMIYEATDILTGQGVPRSHIFHEPYYYRLDT